MPTEETEAPTAAPQETAPAEASQEDAPSDEQSAIQPAAFGFIKPILAHAEDDAPDAPEDEPSEENPMGAEEEEEEDPTIRLTYLTAKAGLPEMRAQFSGLREATYDTPLIDQVDPEEQEREYEASVFGTNNLINILLGGGMIAAIAIGGTALFRRRKKRDKTG